MEIQELKAAAYDLIAQKQQIEQRLMQVNQAIAEAINKPKEVKAKK